MQHSTPNDTNEVIRKLKCISMISLMFMVVEIVGGMLAHSIAIMADAFHLLADVSAYIISLYAVYLSLQPPPKQLTFGYQKVQPLGALINIGLIWVVTIELVLEATSRIIYKSRVQQPIYMLITSIFGLCCNLYIMKILHSDTHNHQHCQHNHTHSHQQQLAISNNNITKIHKTINDNSQQSDNNHSDQQTFLSNQHHQLFTKKHQHHHQNNNQSDLNNQSIFENINLEAAYIHILSDIILSIGVIISAIIIYLQASMTQWTYWQLADPFCTYFFSIIALYSTIPIIKQSVIILLDGYPHIQILQSITTQLNNYGQCSYLKIWAINRKEHYAIVKILPYQNITIDHITQIFKLRKIHVTIQLTPRNNV